MAKVKQILVGSAPFCSFTTIQSAVDSLENLPAQVVEIIILAGTYCENIRVYRDNLIFSGIGEVKIQAGLSAKQLDSSGQMLGTFQTPTFFINAQNITLNNLTIENIAGQGQRVGQAVALYSEGTNVVVNHCRLLAFQDTLCVGPLPEKNKYGQMMPNHLKKNYFSPQTFYLNASYVEGTIDFIFGGGTGVFTNCELVSKFSETTEPNFISAPSTLAGVAGFTFEKCFIHGTQPYYLGRPWREFGQSTFSGCYFDERLEKKGWDEWGKVSNTLTARFAEVANHYQGPVERAPWIKFLGKEGK